MRRYTRSSLSLAAVLPRHLIVPISIFCVIVEQVLIFALESFDDTAFSDSRHLYQRLLPEERPII